MRFLDQKLYVYFSSLIGTIFQVMKIANYDLGDGLLREDVEMWDSSQCPSYQN